MITSENQTVCFPKFVLTVFCCSTSFTNKIVLSKMLMEPVNAIARWWHCVCLKCVSGPWSLEKTLNFLRCIDVIDLVLKYGSDINEENWLQLLFYFLYWRLEFTPLWEWVFFSYVSGFKLKFSPKALLRKRLHLDSKNDLTTNGLVLGFLVRLYLNLSTSYLHGLKSAWTAHLLFFFDDIKIFRCLVWGVFWSVL